MRLAVMFKSVVVDTLNGIYMEIVYRFLMVTDGSVHKMVQYTRWDLIIAHPPCTDLCVSGARHFERKRKDGSQRKSIEFFCKFLSADCERIAIENPVGIISGDYITKWFPDLVEKYNLPRKYSQKISPWMFGDNVEKLTCLWLKGLPNLIPSVTVKPDMEYKEWVDKKTGKVKRQCKWYYDAFLLKPKERAKVRSKTFPGIAKAMAQQWGVSNGENEGHD